MPLTKATLPGPPPWAWISKGGVLWLVLPARHNLETPVSSLIEELPKTRRPVGMFMRIILSMLTDV